MQKLTYGIAALALWVPNADLSFTKLLECLWQPQNKNGFIPKFPFSAFWNWQNPQGSTNPSLTGPARQLESSAHKMPATPARPTHKTNQNKFFQPRLWPKHGAIAPTILESTGVQRWSDQTPTVRIYSSSGTARPDRLGSGKKEEDKRISSDFNKQK